MDMLDTQQQTPRITDTHRDAIEWLWREMGQLYGDAWTRRWKLSDDGDVWARGLIALNRDQIMQAYQHWLEHGQGKFVPNTPAEFAQPWRDSRRQRTTLGNEYDPPPPRDTSAKGLAWRSCQSAYALRVTGLAFGAVNTQHAIDVRAIAYSVPLCTSANLSDNKRAFEELKSEFEKAWAA